MLGEAMRVRGREPPYGLCDRAVDWFALHGGAHGKVHCRVATAYPAGVQCASPCGKLSFRMTAKEHRPKQPPRARADRTKQRPVGLRRIKLGEREVVTQGIARRILQDLFHYFMTVSWPQAFGTIAAFFLLFDLLFGWLYDRVPGCVANLNPPGFLGAFFFSVETLATVGYGDMHPQTLYGHAVAMVEIFVGLMMLALITGIMFARFSRPRARFMFARNAVVRPLDGKLTLMFRAANERQNVVQEASALLRMLRDEVSEEGFRIRRITDLALVRARHPVFALGWTIMH
jgi:inward rectifier potassium channel